MSSPQTDQRPVVANQRRSRSEVHERVSELPHAVGLDQSLTGSFPHELSGDVPSPINPPPGCRFHTRCPDAFDRCPREIPQFQELAPGHNVACHLY